MEIDPRTAEWDVVEEAIIQTIDEMIRAKHADHLKIYTLIKAAILEECERLYKNMRKPKE